MKIIALTVNPSVDISTSVARIEPGRKLRCKNSVRHPGGGGVNVARVVKRLGGDCAAIYPAGGTNGELLVRMLKDEQIRCFVIPIANEIRADFSVLEDETDDQYRFVMPGPNLHENEWQEVLDMLAGLDLRGRYLVASGSLPPGVPADFYARAVRIAKEKDARVVLDTSGAALEAALAEGVHLAKPNLGELAEITKSPAGDEKAAIENARKLVRDGRTEFVAVTLAEKGAVLASKGGVLRAQGLKIVPVSTVGAGDSFLAGMVLALSQGAKLEDALRQAVAAGSAALLTPGTELCRPEDVKRLFGEVVIGAQP